MSCNGCRVLRKGCSETCILRPCLQWIDSPDAQGHATVFVAKFFGRAGLMNFISSAPEPQRPALFQSLLFEACGRTVNPVTGAVGLLWAGNWDQCQAAVETVLRGGTLRPLTDDSDGASETGVPELHSRTRVTKRRKGEEPTGVSVKAELLDLGLDLCLSPSSRQPYMGEMRRPGTPSEGSVTTSAGSRGVPAVAAKPVFFNLFV